MTQPPNPNPDAPYHEVVMARADLEHLPRFELPAGFALRPYHAGDDESWTAIHRGADAFNVFTPGTFRDVFGHDEDALVARQRFLLGPHGAPIGTATAWFDAPRSEGEIGIGRVHWVAIVPEFQRRGLAKPLLSEVLHLLRDLGHERAVLSTDTRRPAAIALYTSFGFEKV